MDDQAKHETSEVVDSGKHGKDYELEMSKFLFKRILYQNFDDFKFTREKTGLGKFDDLSYLYDVNGTKKFSLVQLKHRKNETEKISYSLLAEDEKGPFYLPKYCCHYLARRQKIASDPDFQNGALENLIICTNIDFDQDLGVINKEEIINSTNNILFKGTINEDRKFWRLKISDVDKKKIFPDCYRPDNEKLADELVRHVMVSKAINIKEMKKVDDIGMVTKYHVSLAKEVIDVNNNKLKVDFLEAGSIGNQDVFKLKECFMNSADNFCTKYEDKTADELKAEFGGQLSKCEGLKKRIDEFNKSVDRVAFFKKQKLPIPPDSFFGDENKYPNDEKELPKVLILNEADINIEIDVFLNNLMFAVNQTNNEAIIKDELGNEVYIEFNKKMKEWYDEGWYKGPNTVLRNWITKRKLMDNALEFKVNFQGKDRELKKILPENIGTQFLDPDIIMRTFCSMEMAIGCKLDDLGETRNYHVSRFLLRIWEMESANMENELEENEEDVFLFEYLTSPSNDAFITSLLPTGECLQPVTKITANSKFIYIESDEELCEFFSKYSKLFHGKTIHHFTHESWSTPSFDRDVLYTEYIYEADICNNNCSCGLQLYCNCNCSCNRIATVVAEPGMGKSTLVKSISETLAKETNKNEKPNFVIKIELKCYWKEIKKMQVGKIESVVDFLSLLDGFREFSFLKNIIKHFLEKGERIILLFDGFDELYDDGTRENMLKLLTYLRNETKVKHVCVTSRQHCEKELKNALGVDSFLIKEITEEEQINFLTNFAKQKHEDKEDIIRKNSENLVKKFNEEVGRNKKSFLGIPLQTHMFAVAYEKELPKDNPNIPESLAVVQLFEDFFRRKCEIYIEEKEGIPITYQNRAKIDRMMKDYDNMHQYFAIRFGGIFSDDYQRLVKMFIKEEEEEGESEDDDDKKKEMKTNKDIVLQIGVLYESNDVMYFTHRSFAEYLIAKSFVSFSLKKDNYKYKHVFEDILNDENFTFLLYLFDQQLVQKKKFSAHKDAMTGDEEKIKSLSKEDLTVKDSLGRTPFYYAVKYRQDKIIDILIDKGIPVDWEDNLSHDALYKYEEEFRMKWRGKKPDENDDNFKKFLKFSNHVLQINDSELTKKLCHAYSEKLEKGNLDWKLLEDLINRGCNIFFAFYFTTLAELGPLPVSIFKAVLNRLSPTNEDKYVLSFFYFLFNNYFVYLQESEVKDLLQEYERRLQQLTRRHYGINYGSYFYWIKPLELISSSLPDFLKRFKNASKIFLLFLKLNYENSKVTDNMLVRFDFRRLRNYYFFSLINCEKLKIKSKRSISSLKKDYDNISQEEKGIVDTVSKYEKELGFTCESNTMNEDYQLLVENLIKTSDGGRLLFLMSDITEATFGGNTQRLRDGFNEAETLGWLKAAVRGSDSLFKHWEYSFNKGIKRVYYDFDHDFSVEPPKELREVISEYEKKF